MLPITNKTILKESKILGLVCRLAEHDEAEDLPSQSSLLLTPPVTPSLSINLLTPPTSSVTTPTSTPPVIKDTKEPTSILSSAYKDKPPKKRVKFADEPSSSDNDSRGSDSVSDIPVVESNEGDTSPTENVRKRLRSSKKSPVSDLHRQAMEKSEPVLNLAEKVSEEEQEISKTTDSESTQESEIDSTENIESANKESDLSSQSESAISDPVSDSSVIDQSEKTENVASADSEQSETSSEKMDQSELASEPNDSTNNEDVKDAVTTDTSEDIKVVIKTLAKELLVHWSELKEIFRIPKKEQVAERKRIERELGGGELNNSINFNISD